MGNQSSMQGKVFTGELRAEVSLSSYVYTANLYDNDVQGNNSVWIGQTIPSTITQYSTPAAAISSLEAAYASAHSGATASLPFYLKHTVESNNVTESYVGFEVSSTMATANPGMTAGTYYLKGGDNGAAYEENKATLLSAFGSTYCTDDSLIFRCNVSGLVAGASSYGIVGAEGASSSYCEVFGGGNSYCGVSVDDGGGLY